MKAEYQVQGSERIVVEIRRWEWLPGGYLLINLSPSGRVFIPGASLLFFRVDGKCSETNEAPVCKKDGTPLREEETSWTCPKCLGVRLKG